MASDSHDLKAHAHHDDAALHNRAGERRTRWVVYLTAAMMISELTLGYMTGSLALTADGWHMGTHVGALGLTLVAYWYARRHAGNDQFSFGTGKIYALAGFTSGVLLAVVALHMVLESIEHLVDHPPVAYLEALIVASIGLGVNLVSAFLLSRDHSYAHDGHFHGHGHGHGHDHGASGASPPNPTNGSSTSAAKHDHAGHDHAGHDHASHDHASHDHADAKSAASTGRSPASTQRSAGAERSHEHGATAGGTGKKPKPAAGTVDFNLRAAYIHILADAMTSFLAVIALALGHVAGLWFLDPLMGIVGAGVILWWTISLCRLAMRQLLDVVSSPAHEAIVRTKLESIDDVRVSDLHVWELGPGKRSCIVALVTAEPRDLAFYRDAVLDALPVAHLTIEIHRCELHGAAASVAHSHAHDAAHHHEH